MIAADQVCGPFLEQMKEDMLKDEEFRLKYEILRQRYGARTRRACHRSEEGGPMARNMPMLKKT